MPADRPRRDPTGPLAAAAACLCLGVMAASTLPAETSASSEAITLVNIRDTSSQAEAAAPARWSDWTPLRRDRAAWEAEREVALLRPADAVRAEAVEMLSLATMRAASPDPAERALAAWAADEAALALSALEIRGATLPLGSATPARFGF